MFVIYKEIEEKVIQKVNDMWKLVIVEFFWADLSSDGKMDDERERTFPKKTTQRTSGNLDVWRVI